MQSTVICVVISIVSVTLAMPYDAQEDRNSPVYHFLHRSNIQNTKVGISSNGVASISHRGQIYNNNNLNVNGGAFAAKPVNPNGPATYGGNVVVAHSSGSGLNAGATHIEGRGTNFNAQGRVNLYNANNGNTRVDAVGTYSRHYGGPGGTGKPSSSGGIEVSHNF